MFDGRVRELYARNSPREPRLIIHKDRGGPAQLGIRDWAGLKGHIDDRNLPVACSLASEGRSEGPRGTLGAAQTGTVLSLSFFS